MAVHQKSLICMKELHRIIGTPLLSIIIPCYNCATVIVRCLDSIDYSNAEIIVVNDGSTDNSAQVVSDYSKVHSNVRLICKENGGVSSARNFGLKEAVGKYIMFVDADDYVVPSGIERMVDVAESMKADVVKFSYRTVREGVPQDFERIDDLPFATRVIKGMEAFKRNDVPDYLVWDGLYLRNVIIDNQIWFHTDLCLHEDDVFMGELYCHAETIVVTDLPLYRYVVASAQSSTHNQSKERQRRLIESGYLAIGYRGCCVEQYCPEAMPMERLKYMRWVCRPNMALEAGFSLREYKELLGKFKESGCWPLDYKWIHAARLDWSWRVRVKNRIKTFLCNHPGLAYLLLKRKFLR